MALKPAWRFDALPTTAKLFLLLTAALLPIGLIVMAAASHGFEQARAAIRSDAQEQARSAAGAVESLIARNSLALRIAANAALREGLGPESCDLAKRALGVSPAVARQFTLRAPDGRPVCASGDFPFWSGHLPLVAPGDIRVWISAERDAILFRVGVAGGMGTGILTADEVRSAARAAAAGLREMAVTDGRRSLMVIDGAGGRGGTVLLNQVPIAAGQLTAITRTRVKQLALIERAVLLLPVLMWVLAAVVSWLAVNRLLIAPLRRLQGAVATFDPGEEHFELPANLGPAREITELGESFSTSFDRIRASEMEMAAALEGQRRLVREVHHRVKNNLQVVASLLSIHSRNVATNEAREAYAAIGRRVDALAVVHRNHFAEVEDSRGIALRPLLTELAAGLRGSAPEAARRQAILLDIEELRTTQDSAISATFLVTEIVEFAMLHTPDEPVDIELRRTGPLAARLSISSPVLTPERAEETHQRQFERIVAGLAKQLRSPLDRKLGRYAVDLPVFPD